MRTVTNLVARPHLKGRRIDLTWDPPPDSDFDPGAPLAGLTVARRTRDFALERPDEAGGSAAFALDVVGGFSDTGLDPLRTYYYTVFARVEVPEPTFFADAGARVACFSTENYGLTDRLYKLLPAVHQSLDALGSEELAALGPDVRAALAALPANLRGRGPLYRFFYAAAPFDLMRSLAEGLRRLRDLDRCPPDFLPALAQWVGWDLDRSQPLAVQRNEIRFAPRLYRGVGTVPNLRTMVSRYTGWTTKVAEFAQQIARANAAPQLNVFALEERAGGWEGADDASVVLGFGPGNRRAQAGPPARAALPGAAPAPFALRPGMTLSVAADGRDPRTVVFAAGDFAAIERATAAEVVAALNATLPEVVAAVGPNGTVVIESRAPLAGTAVEVVPAAASLVTLEGAPRGRLSVAVEGPGRARLFYEAADPQAPATAALAARALAAGSGAAGAGVGARPIEIASRPLGRVRYKTFRGGAWGTSLAWPVAAGTAQGAPAAAVLGDGSLWVAWVDHPDTPRSRVRYRIGTPGAAQPARLQSRPRAKFAITPGTYLVVRRNGTSTTHVELRSAQFADPKKPAAAEVAAALQPGLAPIGVSVRVLTPGNVIVLETPAGGAERLEVDLGRSTAARALGFDATNATATGAWGDEVAWGPPADVHPPDGLDPASVVGSWAAGAAPPAPTLAVGRRAREVRVTLSGTYTGLAVAFSGSADDGATFTTGLAAVREDTGAAVAGPQEPGAAPLSYVVAVRDLTAFRLDLLALASGSVEYRIDAGRFHADLFALADADGKGVQLFWATHPDAAAPPGSGMAPVGNWQLVTAHWAQAGSTDAGVWSGGAVLTDAPDDGREPSATRDPLGNTWVVWAQRAGPRTGAESWTLRRRVRDLGTGVWGAAGAVTVPPQLNGEDVRVADREPSASLLADGTVRVFFRSDRSRGPDLWSVGVASGTLVPGDPVRVTSGPSTDADPVALGGGPATWLVFRSDRSVAPAHLSTEAPPAARDRAPVPRSAGPGPVRSLVLPETGTVRRFAGTVSPVIGDAARNSRHRSWDDLISYTPQKPGGAGAAQALTDGDLYTRGTVGLFVSPLVADSPLSRQKIDRLRQVLARFLPANVRAVVILSPQPTPEAVYGAEQDIDEKYFDKYPFVEYLEAPSDDSAVSLPQVTALLSNRPGDTSADPADKTTLRRRTYSPPPQ